MIAARALIAAMLVAATPLQAQVPPGWQPRPGAPAFDQNRYQADQNRYEMERLRAQADQREAFARQQQMEAGLARQRLEAARQPALQPAPPATLRSPEEERVLRRSAEERRRALANGVGQIDAWLDRPAN